MIHNPAIFAKKTPSTVINTCLLSLSFKKRLDSRSFIDISYVLFQIREETNTQIDLPAEGDKNDNIVITGKKEQVEEARERILKIQNEQVIKCTAVLIVQIRIYESRQVVIIATTETSKSNLRLSSVCVNLKLKIRLNLHDFIFVLRLMFRLSESFIRNHFDHNVIVESLVRSNGALSKNDFKIFTFLRLFCSEKLKRSQ